MTLRKLLPHAIQTALRNKAINNAKVRVGVSPKSMKELSEIDLEIIVKEEEDKILSKAKSISITALAALLGISWA